MNETEIKFRVPDIESLATRLRQLGLDEATPRTHEMNTLFDLPGHLLRNRGDLLRLRKYGDSWVLTHKAKNQNYTGPHKSRLETETAVEDGEKMEAILRALGFEPAFRYEKFRAEWKNEHGHVLIDETPIGNFAEIEGPPEWIDQLAEKLQVRPKDYISETYAALFLEWKQSTASRAEEMTFACVRATERVF